MTRRTLFKSLLGGLACLLGRRAVTPKPVQWTSGWDIGADGPYGRFIVSRYNQHVYVTNPQDQCKFIP